MMMKLMIAKMIIISIMNYTIMIMIVRTVLVIEVATVA